MKTHAFERGQTLPIIAIAVLLLVALAGFAADVGYHQYQQRVQQTATDSAALAAAAELPRGNWANTQLAGQRDATTNGFTSGANNVSSVNIVRPSAPDPYTGNIYAVEADISASYPTFFERVFGITSVPVTTKAVAISNAPTNWCIVALDTSGTSNIDGHSQVNAPECDIAINNSHLSVGGQSTITTADPVQYSGSLTGAVTSTFSPGPPVRGLPASDPCAQIASCLNLQQNTPATTPCTPFVWSATIGPGTYCGNVKFSGDTTLLAGRYVFSGNFTANNVTISGTGVTIVDLSTNCPNANTATWAVSAPTSGDDAGMLWYAPNCAQTITMNSGDGGMQGIVYFPKGSLTLNSGSTALMMVITGQLTLNSSNTTFSPPPGASITVPRLVE